MSADMVLVQKHDRTAEHQDLYCPDCGRYLGATAAPSLAGIRQRVHCRTCGRWKWIDLDDAGSGHLTKPPTPVNNRSNPM